MAHATDPERVTEDIKDRFENQAQAIVQNGAVGFGELSVLHLSLGEKHVYSQTPADHPLFLLLADIAAQEGMPMDIHMEAVVEDQPTPSAILEASDANPAALEENITAFERLLDYQPKANIIWAHAGWDHTGDRTIELMGRLLDDHPNLFMSLKISEDSLEASWPLDADGIFKEEWKTFLTLYADRFVIGSDQFFGTVQAQDHWGGIEKLLEQLPEDVAQKIAYENAMRLFLLDESVVE
jgi:predicted TIM-barrel fold metal-dependent hydrolase